MGIYGNKRLSVKQNSTELRTSDKRKLSNYNFVENEFTEELYWYTIGRSDPTGLFPNMLKTEFSTLILDADAAATLIINLIPVQFPMESVADGIQNKTIAKKVFDKSAITPTAENLASVLVRENSVSYLIPGQYIKDDKVYFASPEPLTASVLGKYKNQKIYLLLQNNPKQNGEGQVVLDRVDLIRFESNTVQNGDKSFLTIEYTARPIAPKNCKSITVRFDSMVILDPLPFEIKNTSDQTLNINIDATIDEWTFNYFKISTSGQSSFVVDVQGTGEILFADQLFETIKEQTTKSPGGLELDWNITAPQASSTGFLRQSFSTAEDEPTGYEWEKCIPNENYVSIGLNFTFAQGLNPDLIDYLNKEWLISSDNGGTMSLYQDNGVTKPSVGFEPEHPWATNESPWLNDVLLFEITSNIRAYGLSKPKQNPLYAPGNAYGRSRKEEFLNGSTTISGVLFDRKFPSPLFPTTKVANANSYSPDAEGDREFYGLTNVGLRNWEILARDIIWNYQNIQIADTILVQDTIKLPTKTAPQAGVIVNKNLFYQQNLNENEVLIDTKTLTIVFDNEEAIKSITTSRIGNNALFTFRDAEGNICLGDHDDGLGGGTIEVRVPPQILKSPQLSGDPLLTKQTLILI